MKTVVEDVQPIRKLMDGPPCKVHPKQNFWWLSTWNEWEYYCPQCDKRYNKHFEEMPC